MAVKPKTKMRRVPQRMRGRQRVETILAAAAAVFAEQGYEAATTNEIAARAATSIGSLYQFFPNKEALLQALIAQHREELRTLFANLLSPDHITLPTAEFVDQVMDALADFGASHLGFKQFFLDPPASPGLAKMVADLDNEILTRVDEGFALRFPNLSPENRRLHGSIAITMIKSLLSLAASNTAPHAKVLAEVKVVLSNYLELLSHYGVERQVEEVNR